jgi:hypothetical protein
MKPNAINREGPPLSSPFIPLTWDQLTERVRAMLRLQRPWDFPETDAMAAPQTEEAWVGKAAISRQFGVSVRTIESWMRHGLPHSRPSPRMVRFSPKQCDEWYRGQFLNSGRPSDYRPRVRR